MISQIFRKRIISSKKFSKKPLEDKMEEKNRIEKIAQRFRVNKDFNGKLYKYRLRILRSLIDKNRNSVLEMGCGDGIVTAFLSNIFKKVVSIEGSNIYIKRAKKIVPYKNVLFIKSLFEDFYTSEKFDYVICSYILEHVKYPVRILKKAKSFLKRNGYIIIFVPNSNSLHRKIGKALGIIKRLDEITEIDKFAGHRRVYDLNLLKKHVNQADLKCIVTGGCFIKPLANKQMASWDDRLCDALFAVGKELPEICSEIYAKCRVRK